MKCSEVRVFLSQVNSPVEPEPIVAVPSADIDFLSANGYVVRTTKDDYEKGVKDVARLTQLSTQMNAEKAEVTQAVATLEQDERREHSFLFHFEAKEAKDELSRRVQNETTTVSTEEAELTGIEANVNELIQQKSAIDRMRPYGDGYLSLSGLGSLTLNDLNIRNYRVADQEFPDFITEIKSTYAELRSIAERASSYLVVLKPKVPYEEVEEKFRPNVGASALLWSTTIGLAKLLGDPNQIEERFTEVFDDLQNFNSTTPNKLMAAEVMTALTYRDHQELESPKSVLQTLDHQLRDNGVPKELSVGVAATIMAGRRFDGSYPTDRFIQFGKITSSHEARAILAVMNLPYQDLCLKFQQFRSMFTDWGYMNSEDTEIGAAFLAIGELRADEVGVKLQYIVEQLKNYLEYPLVAAAILASIPVLESHEALDLMEKAVTLLHSYAEGLERSELVALAVRMIHGVRNEIVKEIDSTAKIADTPVQFTYAPYPGFGWFYPSIVAHSSYHATFSGMGGFHPAHSHGVGGFAG